MNERELGVREDMREDMREDVREDVKETDTMKQNVTLCSPFWLNIKDQSSSVTLEPKITLYFGAKEVGKMCTAVLLGGRKVF